MAKLFTKNRRENSDRFNLLQELKPAGIGFIRPHSGKVDDKDLFFHKSALKNSSLVDGL